MIIRIEHIRGVTMCVSGARTWFGRYGFDFRDFLTNGIDAQVLLDTGDPLAARVVAFAEQVRSDG